MTEPFVDEGKTEDSLKEDEIETLLEQHEEVFMTLFLGTYVECIKEEVVLSTGHALYFTAAGKEHRHVGSNSINLLGSTSHTIFTQGAHGHQYDGVIFSELSLIDLAGSESSTSSETKITGLRRKEGAYINNSLLTLGTVIGKLSDGRTTPVPFRDSTLTCLLQSSLCGH
ncbi:hypothetical protein ARALYDRAFT_920942 [Arabidopsis lyrata subsp. lyrata]|uniref:Kinesin motor domain-containing protein n=1 Tax=Arabidopsis lyrata subsp. lyrata TaxID=81972 RepID=D7MW73_ARALL|nr:hypothetical protein ARALYDRAFT_920942 [Arabidopsis lyrata subsp. lyrata]